MIAGCLTFMQIFYAYSVREHVQQSIKIFRHEYVMGEPDNDF